MTTAPSDHNLGRRRFTQCAAVGAFAVVTSACGSSDDGSLDGGGTASSSGDGPGGSSNAASDGPADSGTGSDSGPDPSSGGDPGAPVWQTVPTIAFVEGVPSEISVAEYVSDPDGDALTLMLNDVELPAGVTFDAAGMRFVYDGSGPVATTSGHVLAADDGMA